MTNNPWPIDALQDAWQLATRMHDGQKYGGADPGEQIEYMNHIGSVAFEVLTAAALEKDFDTHLAIHCAILHDTLEDTALTYDELVHRFGPAVAEGVRALTKSNTIADKQAKMHDSLARIKKQPKEIWAVKMADRITNLYAPPFYWDNEKKKAYQAEAQLIYHELKEGNRYLAERLAGKIKAYERFLK
ncbi:HD domain-containing protein [Dawidia soli]|uniref:HD domain-containing protein n=1 Tax=Dawidia soli TaxID=2782352 RepID=A0AAP2DDQ9_9BACT|nr:HD domain-containing protein [Dawidia soli]MBT1690286.1 HD domain-containing protein [Dawidia soli]